MDSSSRLEESFSEIDFETLRAGVLDRLKRLAEDPELRNALPTVTKVADSLVRVGVGHRSVAARLEIPKEIAKALGEGTAKRYGGVVRAAGRNGPSGRIMKHLREIRPSNVKKLAKSPTLAFVLVDALQSTLLNEKLAAIELKLKEIDRKLDAQNQAPLRKAIEQMQELPHLKGRNRWERLHQIQNSLREFEGTYLGLRDSRWGEIDHLMSEFTRARVTNTGNTKKLCFSRGTTCP